MLGVWGVSFSFEGCTPAVGGCSLRTTPPPPTSWSPSPFSGKHRTFAFWVLEIGQGVRCLVLHGTEVAARSCLWRRSS